MGSSSYQAGQSDRGASGRIRGLLRCCTTYIVGAMLTTMCIGSQAGEPLNGDISLQLAELRGEADRAVLYIGPRPGTFRFVHQRTETDLPQIGCTYQIGKDHIDELLDILVNGQIRSEPEREVDARTGVYIYAGDRLLSKLVFADAFVNEGMRGIYKGITPIMSGLTLQSALREFAEKHVPSSTHYGCEKGGMVAPAPKIK